MGTLVDSSEKYFQSLVEASLVVNKNEAQSNFNSIYSQFIINNEISSKFLAQSNFSTLKIIRINGQFAGKPASAEPV